MESIDDGDDGPCLREHVARSDQLCVRPIFCEILEERTFVCIENGNINVTCIALCKKSSLLILHLRSFASFLLSLKKSVCSPRLVQESISPVLVDDVVHGTFSRRASCLDIARFYAFESKSNFYFHGLHIVSLARAA
jgi:hypothetical protein